MKKMRKFLGLMMVLAMALSMIIPASAADGGKTITITNDVSGYTYQAYQVFKGDIETKGEKKVLTNLVWGTGVNGTQLLTELKTEEAFDQEVVGSDPVTTKNLFEDCMDAEDVARVLMDFGDDSAMLDKFATLVNKYLSVTKYDSVFGTNYTITVPTEGYYFVKNSIAPDDGAYTKYMLKVVEEITTVKPKSEAPTLEKEIKHNESSEWGVVGDNQIGDNVEYRTISTVPNTIGYTKYVYTIHDHMDAGLTFNQAIPIDNSVTIKINDSDTDTLESDYYDVIVPGSDTTNPCTFEVKIDILKAIEAGKIETGDELYTYYSATLNENAIIYDTDPYHNDNKAHLEFSNNPYDDESTDHTPDDIVYDWTFKMNVNKVDGSNNNAALNGAKFVLSESDDLKFTAIGEDGVPTPTTGLIALVKGADGTYRVAKAGEDETTYVIEAGSVTIKGLDDATKYYLYETVAPDGYNKLTAPIEFEIKAVYEDAGDALDEEYPQLTVDGTTESGMATDVVNNSGLELPETGGIGTTIFTVGGASLMLLAVVLLVTKKKMADR